MDDKRYRWLKLHDDFFDSKRIKKMRRLAGGDTYTIIYLKMQLKAINTNGILTFTGLESDFASELALDIDESVDDVRVTLQYLMSCGLCECSDDINFFLPYAVENTGSECYSAKRVREFRERKEQKALHCNADVTHMKRDVTFCNEEVEKEKEKEKEVDVEVDVEVDSDCCDEEPVENSRLVTIGGIGKGVVNLSDDQISRLLEKMGLEMFDVYVARLARFILDKGAVIHNHYQTILKWYKEDTTA